MKYRSETAKLLIDIKAINFNFDSPFVLTSGKKSPVYVDCRKIISFPQERKIILSYAENYFKENKIEFDLLAGGETAGIPYAAFLAERLNKPMIYIRKKQKSFGKRSQIEGRFDVNAKCILIEDLATDGKSKEVFIEVMRENNLVVNDTFVIFYYDIFKNKISELNKLGINIHYLCTWKDILDELKNNKILENDKIKIIEKFLYEPDEWVNEE